MRRSHKKSRYGCRNCKRLHKKCDENKPVCQNCVTAERQCSYVKLPSTPNLPLAPSSVDVQPFPPAAMPPERDAQDVSTPNAIPERGASFADATDERYSLLHLELLHHFQTEVFEDLGRDQPELDTLIQQSIKLSFTTPYLMDEMIAFAAAHKSVASDQMKDYYRSEATRLQTRALAHFNAIKAQLSEETCMPMFWFSAILGQHVFFDTFSVLSDLPTVLDRFVQCLGLHKGICAISSESWHRIEKEMYGSSGRVPRATSIPESCQSGDECKSLLQLLRTHGLNEACRNDVLMLQHMFDTQKTSHLPKSRHIIVTQEWLVRVSDEFVDLVNQRRPEALVVLAHYGVLLHRVKDYWAIGNAGSFLIRSIANHLGSYWAPWLKGPCLALDSPT